MYLGIIFLCEFFKIVNYICDIISRSWCFIQKNDVEILYVHVFIFIWQVGHLLPVLSKIDQPHDIVFLLSLHF